MSVQKTSRDVWNFSRINLGEDGQGVGTIVLLLTQSEVDKTGGSYYGKQQLNYMSVKVRLLSLS